MRILSLDLSTNTGYAILENGRLVDYGTITRKVPNFKMDITVYTDYPDNYHMSLINTSILLASDIMKMVSNHRPDLIVIEETNISKFSQRFSQKLIEFFHFSVCTMLHKHRVPFRYLTQRDWRKAVNAYSTKEDKLLSSRAQRIKKKTGGKVAVIDGKIVGKKTSKHHSVRVVNERFDLKLKLKDNDMADAINLALAGEILFANVDP